MEELECLLGLEDISDDGCPVCRNPAGTCPYTFNGGDEIFEEDYEDEDEEE